MKNINKKWFTLIELIISLWILSIIIVMFYDNIADFTEKTHIDYEQNRSFQNISTLNQVVSKIIKNSYWVNYAKSDISGSYDKLVLYQDKQEKQEIELFAKKDDYREFSQVFIKIDEREIPLHTSWFYITEFDITLADRNSVVSDGVQPWVWVEIEWKSRSPFITTQTSDVNKVYDKTSYSFFWRWIIRNHVPSSQKLIN